VTCEANNLARPIHDRMPVVLTEPTAWDTWLDSALDGATVSELLLPLPSELLSVRPANPVVNSGRHEGPDCLRVDDLAGLET
jgi:putative SOS response-associated peptidase YedK